MDDQPHRCPHCQALVVDRRSAVCTTCRQVLPAEWIMTLAQRALTEKIDRDSKAQHLSEMRGLDPMMDPNVPAIVKILDSNVGPFFP